MAIPINSLGPLKGVRVLDLSRVLAGPFCTMILGDLGAEIIKIEDPEIGDQTRTIPPFVNGESHYFLAINRNKKSVAVDTRTPQGRDVVLALAKQADVVIENFRPGVMDRLGLSYETLKQANPKLVVCSISGYGQNTSMSHLPSFDLVTQAMSGVMSINGEPDGPPTKLGLPMGDLGGGLWAAIGILSSLQHRNVSGEGVHIDLSLLEGLMGLLGYLGEIFLVTGENPGRMGSAHHSVVPYGRFEVADGHIVIALHVGTFWRKFCAAIGRPDLADNPRYKTTADRRANRDELEKIVSDVLRQRTVAEWHEVLLEADVPHGPVNSIGDAMNEPIVIERNFVQVSDHPIAGPVKLVGSPLRFEGRFTERRLAPAPALGEHTETVLRDLLGFSSESIQQLADAKVIRTAGSTNFAKAHAD